MLKDLHRRIDHAALQPQVDETAITQLCKEAIEFNFYAVAVNPAWVKQAAEELEGTDVNIVSVSGFPLGASRSDIKVAEAMEAVYDGAHEIDMVTNIGWLASDRFLEVEAEIRKVRRNLPDDIVLKVIIEAGKLTPAQQVEATKAVINGGAQFVKTCTGFFGGATVQQVKTLATVANGKIEIKASGGIRTIEDCRKLLAAGATRLGSSASVAIIREMTTN
ncbi:MAG TPA: deoxyribose-phosphate aldolase [Candidatus Acidoferrum sp.]|nr:deoxyribose-phosphate aldolase [Candidatus Acidoferrum sp.]